jgi:hypothetical protein
MTDDAAPGHLETTRYNPGTGAFGAAGSGASEGQELFIFYPSTKHTIADIDANGLDAIEDPFLVDVDFADRHVQELRDFRSRPAVVAQPVDVGAGKTNLHLQITAIRPTELPKPLRERGDEGL